MLWEYNLLFLELYTYTYFLILVDYHLIIYYYVTNGGWSYLPTPPLGQDMTQGQFLSEVWQVWIQSFPSPRLVA